MAIHGYAELKNAVGKQLGPSPWQVVEQADIDTFAALSGDNQWIHVDASRAAAGPFGTTVSHGLLTLSQLPKLIGDLREIAGMRMALNYGYDRVRFPAPLPAGSRIRGWITITGVDDASDGGVQVRSAISVEAEGEDKPCLVADHLIRVYF